MRALLLFAALTAPAFAQAPVTQTAPPNGFTKVLPLWPGTAPLQTGTTEGDIPKIYTYPRRAPARTRRSSSCPAAVTPTSS